MEKQKVFIPVEAKDYTHVVFIYSDNDKIEKVSVEEQEGYFFTDDELVKEFDKLLSDAGHLLTSAMGCNIDQDTATGISKWMYDHYELKAKIKSL